MLDYSFQNLRLNLELHFSIYTLYIYLKLRCYIQEDSRLKSLRVSLEEERRVTREQLEAERGLVQRTKEEFLSQQRQMMLDINEERRTLALERAEVSAAQRGMMNKEKQKHNNFTKVC